MREKVLEAHIQTDTYTYEWLCECVYVYMRMFIYSQLIGKTFSTFIPVQLTKIYVNVPSNRQEILANLLVFVIFNIILKNNLWDF